MVPAGAYGGFEGHIVQRRMGRHHPVPRGRVGQLVRTDGLPTAATASTATSWTERGDFVEDHRTDGAICIRKGLS